MNDNFSEYDGGACFTSTTNIELLIAAHQDLLALIDKVDNVIVKYQTHMTSEELQYPSSLITEVCNITTELKLKQTRKFSDLLQYPLNGISKLSKTDPIQLIHLIYTVAKSCEAKSEQMNKKEKIFGKKYIKEIMKFLPIELFPVHKGMVANLDEFLKLFAFIR